MRHYLVVGNWKMHGSKASAHALIEEFKQHLSAVETQCEIVVCPPTILIPPVAGMLSDSAISWGAQNTHEQREGAYTGEVSAWMLADNGCRYVIIGHSERRCIYAETDRLITAKFVAAQQASVTPILCLGESLAQREAGRTLDCIDQQLNAVVDVVGIKALENAVLAYEPIWAIGTGKTASPQQAQQVHAHIRQVVAKADSGVADKLRILYGGSVNAANASSLFAQNDIDGALVGGASLKAQDFFQICQAACLAEVEMQ